MDAMSKELETWNLTFLGVLATLINLMWRKYFSVLLLPQVVNAICKFLRLHGGIMTSYPLIRFLPVPLNWEKDKTATYLNLFNVPCRTLTCFNSSLLSL